MKIIIDTECYKNYFLLSAKSECGTKLFNYEKFNDSDFPIDRVRALMSKRTTVGFNTINYDLPMLSAACSGYSNAQLKELSDDIILSKKPAWMVCQDWDITVPEHWDNIDLIEVAPGQASLKIYGGRIDAPKMQDLPIEPDAVISQSDREELLSYCENDLDTTLLLYQTLDKQIRLRENMSKEYGIDLRSKSDAQIAEATIKSELTKMTRKRYRRPDIPPGTVFRYKRPDFIQYKSQQLKDVLRDVLDAKFVVGKNGQVQMPKELADRVIEIGSSKYRMGIGGLHSSEKKASHHADDNVKLADWDVASYYPNIILGQSLYPKHLGLPFLKLYAHIVSTRLQHKKAMNEKKERVKILRAELAKITS